MNKTISFQSSHNSRKIVTKYQLLKKQYKLRILVKEEYKRGLLISHILGQIKFFWTFLVYEKKIFSVFVSLSLFFSLSFSFSLSLSLFLSLSLSFCFSLSLSLLKSLCQSPSLLFSVMISFSKIRLILAAILN